MSVPRLNLKLFQLSTARLNTGRLWLMKSEPENYSIDDLARDKHALWDGVRNYQARNFMMRDMQPQDLALFYHSNAQPSGIAGLMEISAPAAPDPTQFDPQSQYYFAKATKSQPVWYCVKVRFIQKLPFLPLPDLRQQKALKSMALLQKGQRLSILPCKRYEFEGILNLCQQKLKNQ